MLAQEETRRLGHNFVGTEHLLLGLVREKRAMASEQLTKRGVNLKRARLEVEAIIGQGAGFVAIEIPFTPRGRRALEFSWDEARKLEHSYICAEHLLLGLLRLGDGTAAKVLRSLDLDSSELYHYIFASMGGRDPDFDISSRDSFWYDVYSDQGLYDVFVFAQTIARALDEDSIRVEHILVGLLEAEDCVSSKILKETGLDLDRLKVAVSCNGEKGKGSPQGDPTVRSSTPLDGASCSGCTMLQKEADQLRSSQRAM